ncbi:MAG: GNAT family N-acetyltransferase [Alphaproteobacteria bacterium]|nr:GNAT family N-acetyltransferase [Alphaproteobacteria bacterium]
MRETVATTERLILRPWTLADQPRLSTLLTDPITMKHWPEPFDADDVRHWLERALQCWQEDRLGRWAVERRADGLVLGDCGLVPTELDGEAVTDLGYILQAPHHGQGYGKEAAAAALHYGTEILGLNNIVCHMAEDNIPSRRTAEALGMAETRRFTHTGNRNKTHIIYRLPN